MTRYLVLLLLLVCLLLVQPRSPVLAQDKEPPADNIIPIASGITDYQTTLELDGQKIAVALAYAQQGNTVFVLPVWHVRGVRRLTENQSAVTLKPTDWLVSPDAKGEQRLEFDVVNLLEIETLEKAIQDKLKARIAQRSGLAAEKLQLAFAVPQIKPQSYRFALIAPGRGDESLPAEVPISAEIQRLPNGLVRFSLEPAALTAVEKENGGPLKLTQTHLRCVGLMRVRFEQTQVIAQVDFIRGAVTELRKSVSSIKDSSGRTPEVFVDMPEGGAVQSDNEIRRLALQSLAVSIASRSGADTTPILNLVQAELNGLLDRQRIQVTEDNKRLAFLLENQVAITATVGEIKRLAKLDEKEREAAFKAAADDYTARRTGKASNYSGSLGFSTVGSGYGVKVGVSGNISNSSGTSSQEDTEQRTKRETEALKKNFDKLMKEFDGKVPTLSGISFDDTTLSASMEQASKSFKESKLTTGDSLHRWPLVSLSGQLDTALSAQDLVRQYAILKADYERLQKLLGTPQQLAEAKANLERVKQLSEELKQRSTEFETALAAFEKTSKQALAKVDETALAKLTRELAEFERKVDAVSLKGHEALSVYSVAFSPNSKRIVTGSADKTAKVWDVEKGQELLSLTGHTSTVRAVAFSPDGTRIVTGSGDMTAKVWDVEKGQELLSLTGHAREIVSVAFSPDGKRIVTGSLDKTAKVWDAEKGQELLSLNGHGAIVSSVGFSPDGKRIATGSSDKTAKVWDAEKGQELLSLTGHTSFVSSVGFSPDGRRIVTGSADKTAKVWDVEKGQELLSLTGHTSTVRAVAFSPNSKRIVTGSLDKTAKVWDAEKGQELFSLKGHANIVWSVAFSPDGKRIVTGSWDKTAKVWDAE